jgi:phosphoribosylformimino-5-aminoimidazole carboxamide ribotide isomerase
MIWRAENAKCLHIVDFDHSQTKSKRNFEAIERIASSIIIPIQYAGGVSSLEEAKEIIQLGIYRLVIGSLFIDNRSEFLKIFETFGPKKIIGAIDQIDNQVVIRSRTEKTKFSPLEIAQLLYKIGIERIVLTDISRNGSLQGPNIDLIKQIGSNVNCKITYAGGIKDKDDLFILQELSASYNLDSVIIGRALYENKFPCQKLWRKAEKDIFN